MSKIYFNEHQRKLLEMNPNVSTMSNRAIQYSSTFKIKAIKENQAGKGPTKSFNENGFDLEMIGEDRVKGALKSWRRWLF